MIQNPTCPFCEEPLTLVHEYIEVYEINSLNKTRVDLRNLRLSYPKNVGIIQCNGCETYWDNEPEDLKILTDLIEDKAKTLKEIEEKKDEDRAFQPNSRRDRNCHL